MFKTNFTGLPFRQQLRSQLPFICMKGMFFYRPKAVQLQVLSISSQEEEDKTIVFFFFKCWLLNSVAVFPMHITLVRKEIKASAKGAEQKKGAHAVQQMLLVKRVS